MGAVAYTSIELRRVTAGARPSKISRNSQKLEEHQVGISQHRLTHIRVSCHFREFLLIAEKHSEERANVKQYLFGSRD
ncbi:hypothetical protein ACYSNR_06215 [Enterococcus sp. LJL128]